jgi:hypothetical protein
LLTLLYLVYIGIIFVYAFVIWPTTLERVITFVAGLAVLGVTAAALRGIGLRHRLVAEILIDDGHPANSTINIVESGKARVIPLSLQNGQGSETHIESPVAADLRTVTAIALTISSVGAREVKVWVHHLTAEGRSVNRAFTLNINGQQPSTHTGSILVPCQPEQSLELKITFPDG